jgi:hypothetical protein
MSTSDDPSDSEIVKNDEIVEHHEPLAGLEGVFELRDVSS